ncbi:ribonuclease H-like domain-containing protein [Tanacetum coccineum]
MPKKLSDFEVNTKVKYNIDRQVNYSKLSIENYNFSTSLNKISEPKSCSEAANDIRWIKAMNQEMEALNRNGTCLLQTFVGRKPIRSNWMFKVKYKSSGNIERFKARLVAKGFNQKEGIDYEETFSLVVKIVIVRCLHSIAVHNNWPIYQLDINNAFLYGELVDDVYMKLPEGYFSKDDNRFMHAPLQSHLKLAFRVLRYLKNAPSKGISFVKDKELNLSVYVDSDWAKCKATRKLVTRYYVFFGKSLISWKSKKQSMLAKSSTEAEYRAINTVTCEVIWIHKILTKLNIKISLPVPIHCDNSSAIQIASNLVFHEKP